MSCWTQKLSPSRTVVTSFTPRRPSLDGEAAAFEEGDWILCLAASSSSSHYPSSCNSGTVSAVLSNGNVHVYDATSLLLVSSFSPGGTLQVGISNKHNTNGSVITDLVYGPENSVIITVQDGSLVVTDLRQPAVAAIKATIPSAITGVNSYHQESALSVALGFDGYLAAVSSNKAKVHFFDLRRATGDALLGSYVDSHTDAITAMAFHPEKTSLLLTGGEDGLACCFDTTQPTEELALSCVMSVGAPLRKVGFCGDSPSPTVYCLTGSETASLWDVNTANCLADFGGNSLRKHLSQKQQIDYLVDAHWDSARQELLLTAGNCSGDGAVFSYKPLSSNIIWNQTDMLVGGHRGVVRAWCPLSKDGQVIVTAGEDARLCEWNRQAGASSSAAAHNICGTKRGAVGSGPLRRQRQRSLPSASPY